MATLITDLGLVAQQADDLRNDFEIMCFQLEYDDDLTDEQIDAWIDEISTPIREAIDCTQCANCCRVLDVQVGDDDLERLTMAIGGTVEQLRETHVIPSRDEEEQADPDIAGVFRHQPCSFLAEKLCSVYAHRPEACRSFPNLTPNFRWLGDYWIRSAQICPIVFNTMVQLAEQVDDFQRDAHASPDQA